jgi:hypothetical protein
MFKPALQVYLLSQSYSVEKFTLTKNSVIKIIYK